MKNNKKLVKKEIKIINQDRIDSFKEKFPDPKIFCDQESELAKDGFLKKTKNKMMTDLILLKELVQMNGLKNGYWISHMALYNPA